MLCESENEEVGKKLDKNSVASKINKKEETMMPDFPGRSVGEDEASYFRT